MHYYKTFSLMLELIWLSEGLDYMHSKIKGSYIVHGDDKPANVSVSGDEENKNDLVWLIIYAIIELKSTVSRSFCL